MQEKADQPVPGGEQQKRKQRDRAEGYQKLGAEGVAHALAVVLSVVLGGEDARAGKAAEDAEVEHKQQLVDDGHAGHGLRAHLTDHEVVQKADEIGDDILDEDRRHDR